jgi:GNAT superfamily N-acetyltransferase
MSLQFSKATRDDLPAIVRLLADDVLGAKRERYETPLPESYLRAFEAIDADPNNELVVARMDGEVVGVLQLTFIPYLTYQGGWRALIEAVRVDSKRRSQGLGKALFEWAIDRARAQGCHLVQLTTDKARADARRFYEALGFVASHEGMKLHLEQARPPRTPRAAPRADRAGSARRGRRG